MHRNAAGLAVGAAAHWVAVPWDRAAQPVQRFGACPAALSALAAWLRPCQRETGVLESTGVDGMARCEGLAARGFAVRLVDAHDARPVPGRQTDGQDCPWRHALHPSGLRRG